MTTATVQEFALLSTARLTISGSTNQVYPSVAAHIQRLKAAHSFFRSKQPSEWALEFDDEDIASHILQSTNSVKEGDHRVRILLPKSGKLEIQILPMFSGAPPFAESIAIERLLPIARRRVMLDTLPSSISESCPAYLYDYKTTARAMYDVALKRTKESAQSQGFPPPDDVLLYFPRLRPSSNPSTSSTHPDSDSDSDSDSNLIITELSTANLLIQLPSGEWITPKYTPGTPFLKGIMREQMLQEGVVIEAEGCISVEEWKEYVREGCRMVGVNGLR